MNDCIFCKIIKKEIPSFMITETDNIFVFLDINPNTNGHLLFIPKKHYKDILDIPSELLSEFHELIKKMIIKLDFELKPTGYTIELNNGSAGEVKHFHIHLIPRYNNDLLSHQYNKDLLKDVNEIYNILKNTK